MILIVWCIDFFGGLVVSCDCDADILDILCIDMILVIAIKLLFC